MSEPLCHRDPKLKGRQDIDVSSGAGLWAYKQRYGSSCSLLLQITLAITMPFDNSTNSQDVQSSATPTNKDANTTNLTAGTRAKIDNNIIFQPNFEWDRQFSPSASFFATATARNTLLNKEVGVEAAKLARRIIPSFARKAREINGPGFFLPSVGTEERSRRLINLEEELRADVKHRFQVHNGLKEPTDPGSSEYSDPGFCYSEEFGTVIATAALCGFTLAPVSIADILEAGESPHPEMRDPI